MVFVSNFISALKKPKIVKKIAKKNNAVLMFDEIWHDEYEGWSNSNQAKTSKQDILETLKNCVGVKASGSVLYQNDDVLVMEYNWVFPANTARPEGTYAAVEFCRLRDGKIASHQTGMTKLG